MPVLPQATEAAPWKILIADDDHDVHTSTCLALRNTQFKGRSLEFIHAYSGAETLIALQDNPDTALVFLDIIMESEDAGLCTAQRIRELGFKLVRIVFRTGFPGQAPERQVVVDYDIHDYKEKTGLSAQKLYTSLISALRAFDDLRALESHRCGLLSVLELGSSFDFNAVQRYVARMLAEFINLANLGSESMVVLSRPSISPDEEPTLITAQGGWKDEGEPVTSADLPAEVLSLIRDSLNNRQSQVGCGGRTLIARHQGIDLVLFAVGEQAFERADEVLMEVFLINVCQTISNQHTFASMSNDRNALLRGLALQADRWDEHAATSLDRLGRLSTALALRLNTTLNFPDAIDSRFVHDIGIAAQLHDLGNAALPVALLNKRGAFNSEERKAMQDHVAAGLKALAAFESGADKAGALRLTREIIAGHHEYFDGSGYPAGLSGEAIPLSARLVAVTDTYIAMTSPRPHRPALSGVAARAAINAGTGHQFDPHIVQAFFELLDDGYVV